MPDRFDDYMRLLVIRWMRESRASQADVARAARVTETAVSDLMRGKRGVGRDFLEGLANTFGTSMDALTAGARAWDPAAGEPAMPPPRGTVTEYIARYSNFELARGIWLKRGESQSAVDATEAAMRSDSDLHVEDWLAQFTAAKRVIAAAARDPVGEAARKAAQGAEAEARHAKLAAEHKAAPTMKERALAAKAKHTKKGE